MLFQRFIVKVIGGKENSIVQEIKERISTYGFNEYIKSIVIINKKIVKEQLFKHDDEKLPANKKNTANIVWEVLDNGDFKKTTTKISNKFPGYIYVNMQYDADVWYVIRNTPGVLGFLGSIGSGSKPIPMSEVQFQKALQNSIPEEKIIEKKIPLSVGMIVDIVSGKFAKNKGKIVSIDSSNHTVNVQIENLGEVEVFDIDIQRS